jgi:hypothetical protein
VIEPDNTASVSTISTGSVFDGLTAALKMLNLAGAPQEAGWIVAKAGGMEEAQAAGPQVLQAAMGIQQLAA